MVKPIKPGQPYITQKQKALSTIANISSVTGHTAGVFGGIAAGVNITKAMDENGINRGLSIATGIVSAIAVIAGVSIATEAVSGAIRKKADIPIPLSMLRTNLDPESYRLLLGNIEEEDDDSDNQDGADGSLPGDNQEPEDESVS